MFLGSEVAHNGGVDAAARIKAPCAAPSKLRNTLPPLASNDLLGMPSRGTSRPFEARNDKARRERESDIHDKQHDFNAVRPTSETVNVQRQHSDTSQPPVRPTNNGRDRAASNKRYSKSDKKHLPEKDAHDRVLVFATGDVAYNQQPRQSRSYERESKTENDTSNDDDGIAKHRRLLSNLSEHAQRLS